MVNAYLFIEVCGGGVVVVCSAVGGEREGRLGGREGERGG